MNHPIEQILPDRASLDHSVVVGSQFPPAYLYQYPYWGTLLCAGTPFPGELKQGDLRGEESELEGVGGCFEPLASEPHAGDPHDDDPLGLTPNISPAHSMSESDSRNLLDQ